MHGMRESATPATGDAPVLHRRPVTGHPLSDPHAPTAGLNYRDFMITLPILAPFIDMLTYRGRELGIHVRVQRRRDARAGVPT